MTSMAPGQLSTKDRLLTNEQLTTASDTEVAAISWVQH
jgi:hypothetical protein